MGILLFCVLTVVATAGIMSVKGLGLSTGRFYTNEFGAYLVDEGEAMIMSDRTKNQDVFQKLSVGDLILVIHNGIQETYPAHRGGECCSTPLYI